MSWFVGSYREKISRETKIRDIEQTAPYFKELGYDQDVQAKIIEMFIPADFCKLAKMRGWSNEYLRRKFKLDK